MSLTDAINQAITDAQRSWEVTKQQLSSTSVPEAADLPGVEARLIEATYLYTDIVDSSTLASISPAKTVASVMALFVKVAVRIIRKNQGHIRSFDGDRVMGIFTGPNKEHRAVDAALKINKAVRDILNPAIEKQFKSVRDSSWTLRQMTGIATGEALVVKVGIRNNDDLLSAGHAPNFAAKLSDQRLGSGIRTAISKTTYDALPAADKSSNGKSMWVGSHALAFGGKRSLFYTSTWYRGIS